MNEWSCQIKSKNLSYCVTFFSFLCRDKCFYRSTLSGGIGWSLRGPLGFGLMLYLSICLCHRRVVLGIYKVGSWMRPIATVRDSGSGIDGDISLFLPVVRKKTTESCRVYSPSSSFHPDRWDRHLQVVLHLSPLVLLSSSSSFVLAWSSLS